MQIKQQAELEHFLCILKPKCILNVLNIKILHVSWTGDKEQTKMMLRTWLFKNKTLYLLFPLLTTNVLTIGLLLKCDSYTMCELTYFYLKTQWILRFTTKNK